MAQTLGSMAGHNSFQLLDGVTQGQFRDWLDEMREEDQRVADALAARKEKLANIKAAVGGPNEYQAFLRARRDADMSGEARSKRELAYRIFMGWQNMPVPSDDFDLRDDNLLPIDYEQIDVEGFEAGRDGRRRDANPYTPGSELASRWDDAWLRGQAEAVETMASRGGDGDEPRRRGRPPGARDRAPRQRRTRAEMEGHADNRMQ